MSKIICFDLRALQVGHEHRGIGVVARSILENISDDKNKYIFYVFDDTNPIEKLGIQLHIKKYEIVSTPKLKISIKSPIDVIDLYKLSHHSFKNLLQYKPDVFLQFDFALGVPKWKKTKTFCFAYDLIPLIMKNEYLPNPMLAMNRAISKKAKLKALLRSLYYKYKYSVNYKTYKKVDQIISISETTKKSLVGLLNIKPEKIHTIPLAPVAPLVKSSDAIANKIRKPFIFYIGATDSRKRVEEVIFAFNIARGRGQNISLVLSGYEFRSIKKIPNIKVKNAILSSPYKKDIHLVGFIPDSEKQGLYKNALAFVFCTSYEGFGLPIVEAQAAGCPVISYDNSSIKEVAANAARLVKTGDYVEVANGIIALGDKKTREKYIELGKKQSSKFTWENYLVKFSSLIN